MKKRIVSLFLILCMAISVLSLASCSKKKGEGDATQETAATTDRWEILAPDVKALPSDARSIRIELDRYGSASKHAKNNLYLAGDDGDDKVTTVEQMVRARNNKAKDLLGLSIEYVYWDYAWGAQCAQINTAVHGDDPEAPDLFVNMLYDLNIEVLNASFKDVWSIPGSYFDFEADGWLTTWMKNLSFTGDRAYILAGDYFMDVFRVLSLLPFNSSLMDSKASKLAPAILGQGESLGDGEKLSYRFFDLVESGNWTWDVLGKLCEATWFDADGNGYDSIKDTLGIIADENQGFCAGAFVYSCGEPLIEQYTVRDGTSEYNRKQWIRYAPDSSGLNQIFDAVKAVFAGNGSFSTNESPNKGTTEDKPGLAYHQIKFAKGELLFPGVMLLGVLEEDVFQRMEYSYSVVPCPKVNAEKQYNTVIYNTGDAGAINVRTTPDKAKAISAFLQYCTEHSTAIRETFLQTVTKYDTMEYNQGTDRMLDLIYDSVLYGRDKTVEDLVEKIVGSGTAKRWHSMMKNGQFMVGSDEIKQQYDSLVSVKQAVLDDIMRTWYGLPTSGSEGN